MSKGVLIFAHNNRQVDYARMAIIAGGLAAKNLQVPVTLATDDSTVAWMKESNIYTTAMKIFEHIRIVNRPEDLQNRKFNDGTEQVVAPFKNSNRASVYNITPYDRTLLIDSDFFILTDELNNYWDIDSSVLISKNYNDILGPERIGYLDRYVSNTGVQLLWATKVMFTKNEESKTFFNLVNHVRENYKRYADVYRYDSRMYRNDIAFAVARHIMYGFETDNDYSLPDVFSVPDKDVLYDVSNESLKFLVSPKLNNNFIATSVKGRDVHIMNKQSIIRNFDKLVEMI